MILRSRLLFVLILLIGSAVRLYRTTELGAQADEGVHVVVAERIAAGDVLYRDIFENRTPGVEWLLATIFRLAGPSLFWGRWMAVAMSAVTIAALIAGGRLALADHQLKSASGGYVAGSLAGLLFALAPLPVFWSRFIMLENFETAAAALCIAVALAGLVRGKLHYSFISGMLAGLAILAKQSGLVLLPVFGLFWFLQLARSNWQNVTGDPPKVNSVKAPTNTGNSSKKSRRSRQIHTVGFSAPDLKPAGLWLIGCLAILGLMILALILQGSHEQFFKFVSGSDRLAPFEGWPEKFKVTIDWMKNQPLSILMLLGGIVAPYRGSRVLQLSLLWVGVEVGALILPPALDLSGGGLSHYALPAVAAGSLLAGSGLAWGWLSGKLSAYRHRIVLGGLLLSVLFTVPGWLDTLSYVIWESDYPQADLTPEIAIGEALAAVTSVDESILVFANGIFYHWAGRSPGNRYFYYPAYLSDSSLADEAEADLLGALSNPRVEAVLVSSLYLYHRLPPAIRDTLWRKWQPVASFPYAYQQGAFLFLPSSRNMPVLGDSISFAEGIELTAVNAIKVSPATLLVRLAWSTRAKLAVNYTVFVHVVDRRNGTLIAQHDGVPNVGFRPTTSWFADEVVIDWHWIALPPASSLEDLSLSIGLYRAETGQRLQIGTQGQSPVKDDLVFQLVDVIDP